MREVFLISINIMYNYLDLKNKQIFINVSSRFKSKSKINLKYEFKNEINIIISFAIKSSWN